MTCGDKFNKNCPTYGSRVDPAEVDGRPRCKNPRCQRRLYADGRCPRGCMQDVWGRVQERVLARLTPAEAEEWWPRLADNAEVGALLEGLADQAEETQANRRYEEDLDDWVCSFESSVAALETFRDALQASDLTYEALEDAFRDLEQGRGRETVYSNVPGLAVIGGADKERTLAWAYDTQRRNDDLDNQRSELELRKDKLRNGEEICPKCGGELEQRERDEYEEEEAEVPEATGEAPWECRDCGASYDTVDYSLAWEVPDLDDSREELDVGAWVQAADEALTLGEEIRDYLDNLRDELGGGWSGRHKGLPDGAGEMQEQLEEWGQDNYWDEMLGPAYCPPDALARSLVDIADLYAEFGTWRALSLVARDAGDWLGASEFGQRALERLAGWRDFRGWKEPALLEERVACCELLEQAAVELEHRGVATPSAATDESLVDAVAMARDAICACYAEAGGGWGLRTPAGERLQALYQRVQSGEPPTVGER